jgi:hypothetical protein
MYDVEPMLDHDCRAWLGRKLRASYDLTPDPSMSPRLQALVTELIAGGDQSSSQGEMHEPAWAWNQPRDPRSHGHHIPCAQMTL